MAVFRVERNKGYTVMSNYHLRDRNLSLKSKGLLSQMLSLPEDWDYTLKGLSSINKESIDAIRTAVWELEKAGYITRRQGRDEQGNGDPFFLIVGVPVCAAFNGFKINRKRRHPFQRFQKEGIILYVPGQFIYAQCGEFLALGLGAMPPLFASTTALFSLSKFSYTAFYFCCKKFLLNRSSHKLPPISFMMGTLLQSKFRLRNSKPTSWLLLTRQT